jgi:L-ascorbate metabolism protein UlaG (beta-lactamase superfamily)
MRPRNNTTIMALVAGLIGLGWFAMAQAVDLQWFGQAAFKITTDTGGEPAGYIIELENGFKIYHAGDTGVFGDMKFIGEFYDPDLSLLPR